MSVLSLPDVQERPHLSFSQLSTYATCGLRYKLSYIDRVPREASGPAIGGSAVHATIQASEQEGWWQDASLWVDGPPIERFQDELSARITEADGPIRWGGRKSREHPQGEDEAWWRASGPMMLRRYQLTRAAMAEGGFGLVEHGAEMQVLARLPGVETPVLAYIDAVLMHQDGEPLVVDWKTGQVGRSDPLQLATYAALIQQARGITVERGAFIYLRAVDEGRRVQTVDLAPLLPHVQPMYAELVRGVEAGLFMPNPSAWCASCGVRAHCWYGQAVAKEEP